MRKMVGILCSSMINLVDSMWDWKVFVDMSAHTNKGREREQYHLQNVELTFFAVSFYSSLCHLENLK